MSDHYSSVGYPRPVGDENKLPEAEEDTTLENLTAQQAAGSTQLLPPTASQASAALAESSVTKPATAPTVAAGSAGALSGTYYYRVTHGTVDGETEAGPWSEAIEVTDKRIAVSDIPVSSDPRVTYRNVYRTTGDHPVNVYVDSGDSPLVRLCATIADNTTTTLEDNVADAALGVYLSARNTTKTGAEIRGTNGIEFSDDATIVGKGAGGAARGSNRFTAIGKNAGANSSLSFGCTFVGDSAGLKNGTLGGGDDNTFVGDQAGKENTSGLDNAFIGQSSGQNNTSGSTNTFVGEESGKYSTTGSENFFGGESAGAYNGSGDRNTYVGMRAGGRTATSGVNDNVLVGRYTGDKIRTSGNTIVGSQAAIATTTGEKNTIVGFAGGYANVSGSRNVWIGHPDTVDTSTDRMNTVAIGFGVKPGADNEVSLGNASNTDYKLGGGYIRRIVANNFDPAVTGLTGRLMAIAETADGSKAWLKYGSTDTSWKRVDEVTGSATVSGASVATLDVTIAVPADRGCVIDAYLLGATAWTNLRTSGSLATIVKSLSIQNSAFSGSIYVPVGVGTTSTTTATRSRVKIYPAINNRRMVVVERANGRTENDEGASWTLINAGALTSVGIESSGSSIYDGTRLDVRVTNDL